MRTVTYRLERIEQIVARAACSECNGRPKIIAFREGETPPTDLRCRCGARVVLWQSQVPPELDEALDFER
jgi:hypothetical protein